MLDFGRILPQRLKQSATYPSTRSGDSNPSFDGMMNRSKSRLILLDTDKLDHRVQQLVVSLEPSWLSLEGSTLQIVNTSITLSWLLQAKETSGSSHITSSLHGSGLQYSSNKDLAIAATTSGTVSSTLPGFTPIEAPWHTVPSSWSLFFSLWFCTFKI